MGFHTHRYASKLEFLYSDRFSVWENEAEEDESGIMRPSGEKLLMDIPCKISYPSHNQTDAGSIDMNPIDWDLEILCVPTVSIQKGQTITAEKRNHAGDVLASYEGICNEPRFYSTHVEIRIKFSGVA